MTGETNQSPANSEEDLNKSKQEVNKEGAEFFHSLWRFFKNLLNLRNSTDYKGTEASIRKESNFSGANAWILVCSIVIASVGLNVNSIPVVIGAMLISPLMGPILGTGLGMGTNDIKLIWSSLRNLGIAVGLSLAASYFYFLISPIKEPSAELTARTSPHLLDVVVAVFGGLAGIIANSRGEKSNVLPGVAIATALMPPLCTAGYGLATHRYEYFIGAFYLFLLNSVLIAAVTLIVVRYLKFPVFHFDSARRERFVKWTMALLTLALIIPSAYLFIRVVKKEHYMVKARDFIRHEFNFHDSSTMFDEPIIEYNDTVPRITMVLKFGDPLTAREKKERIDRMKEYELEGTKLIIMQNEAKGDDELASLRAQAGTVGDYKRLMEKQDVIIDAQKVDLEQLKSSQQKLLKLASDTLPVLALQREVKSLFPDVIEFSCAKSTVTDFKTQSAKINLFVVRWDRDNLRFNQLVKQQSKLNDWLSVKFAKDSVRVVTY